MHLDDPKHRLTIQCEALEWAKAGRMLGTAQVCLTVHDRSDRPRQRTSLVRVVRQTRSHDQTAEVGIAQTQRTELVTVEGDPFGRIAGVVDQNLLRRDKDPAGGAEAIRVEATVLTAKSHQVD